MKRLLIIGLPILVILGAIVWFLFGSNVQTLPTGNSEATSSPFGIGDDTVVPADEPNFVGEVIPLPETSTSSTEGEQAKLFKLEGSPVAGFVALTRSTTTVVRYADRGTGNIFETKLPQVEKKRLTNQTLPQIYEAYFRDDGVSALFRTLDEDDVIKNMALSLTAPKSTSTETFYTLNMILLRGEIDSLSTGPGDLMTYVLKDAHTISSSKFNGESVKTLLNSSFDKWRTSRLGAGTLIFTKPSSSLPGYAYRLSSGNLTKLLGPYKGLVVTANPAGTHLVYSYTEGNTTHLFGQEIGKSGSIFELSPGTLADKCVGSAQEKGIFYCGAPAEGMSVGEPEQWYQGKTHYSDDIWRFDALTESANLILEPEGGFGVSVDVSLPQISPDGKYLIFVNKTDLSLWAMTLR